MGPEYHIFMNKTRLALFLLLASAGFGPAGHPALAAQLVPLGFEEEMYADVFANPPAVAAQPDGSSVVAWDDDTSSVFEGTVPYAHFRPGRGPEDGNVGWGWLESPAGVPDVDAVTAGQQGYDVIWHTRSEYEEEGAPTRFYRGHLNLRGVPVGKPVRLGGTGTEWVWQVRGNGFMAGWPLPGKHGLVARRLAASGQPTGPELRLNSRPVDHLAGVSVVGLADSSFVAVWLGAAPGSPRRAVLRARRFSPSGKPLGPDFDVNTLPLGLLDASSWSAFKVAAAPGGGFAIAWLIHQATYLRWFNAAGTPLGPEIMATTSEGPEGVPEAMAFDGAGNLVLLSNLEYYALQLRLFDPQGKPQGPPVAVNSDFDDDPWGGRNQPWGGDLAWTGDTLIVAWVAAIFPYDQHDVFMRRFVKK
jgi:hypothetical protein